jgi:superoxide dismutase, Cu-Zn family
MRAVLLSAVVVLAMIPSPAAADIPPSGSGLVVTSGPLTTYDTVLVPAGATATVVSAPFAGTTVVLSVRGLLPDRHYGAHAHVAPCGPTGAAAGAHYQHVVDPVQPSTDPAYANPTNELWLDLTTDDRGAATASTRVAWLFADRRPHSVVVHETHTHTGPGVAGTAGARLACLTVPF